MLKYNLFTLCVAVMLVATGCRQNASSVADAPISPAQIDEAETAGNFTEAKQLIDYYIARNELSADSIYLLNRRKEKMRRIAIDFNKSKDDVLTYIRKYYPDVNDDSLNRWEASKALEYKIIDGQKWYFERAAPNLFRLDAAAIARKAEVQGDVSGDSGSTLKKHLPEVVSYLTSTNKSRTTQKGFRIKFKLTLAADAVPDGETVRCWLPFPRNDHSRQTDVRLLSVNDSNYIISPSQYAHSSLYVEKVAHNGQPTVWEYEFSFRTSAEWHNLKNKPLLSYNLSSDAYSQFTAERPPHILFSDSIKAISKRIVGDETNNYQKARKIFEWADVAFPWAGAREYSTIDNIPAYVIENGHGDCGQVTLVFMTLARYNGIPTRWQSGFMLHPGSVNLHDWCEYYIEGIGWIPLDQSFGVNTFADADTDTDVRLFYSNGIDAYRLIVNNNHASDFFPAKLYPRSDNVDFQRGELEWRGGNLYYDVWDWDIDVSYE
ncbi:MAG: transglutaminase domain-containing protein [Tannerella sp.]|jgi:transglutaminase-like putative cysteine protease|nr:transglutaminase domain-containing protein [Tannerella sp.]